MKRVGPHLTQGEGLFFVLEDQSTVSCKCIGEPYARRVVAACSADLRAAQERIAALEQQLEWHPIETAPKDGTPIWATNIEEIARAPDEGYAWSLWVVRWEARFKQWSDEQSGVDRNPTHWMRLAPRPIDSQAPNE